MGMTSNVFHIVAFSDRIGQKIGLIALILCSDTCAAFAVQVSKVSLRRYGGCPFPYLRIPSSGTAMIAR